jgi:hypothetical protein
MAGFALLKRDNKPIVLTPEKYNRVTRNKAMDTDILEFKEMI